MSTEKAQILTLEQINDARAQGNAITASATPTVSGNTFVFFAAFDGTKNTRDYPGYSNDPQSTAVGQLAEQVANAPGNNVEVGYYPGVGTPDTTLGSTVFPTGQSIITAQKAYDEFASAAAGWLENPDNAGASVTAMLTSFSRGSVAAAIFSQMLYEKGLVYEDPISNTVTVLAAPGEIGVSAGLVISPVNTGASGNLAFANAENMTVVLADNEYRSLYVQSVYDQPDFDTVNFTGNHGDAGDIYDNGLGGIALESYTSFFEKSGLSILSVPPERKFDAGAEVVIHDEALDFLNPQNFHSGSVADGTQIETVLTGRPPTLVSTPTGEVSTFVDYKGDVVEMTRIGGITQSVSVTTTHWDGSATRIVNNYDADGNLSPTRTEIPSPVAVGLNQTADFLSLISAIRSGEPLPIISSGMNISRDVIDMANGNPSFLNGPIAVAGAASSILNLGNAIEEGDGLGMAYGGAQLVGYTAQAFAAVTEGAVSQIATDVASEVFGEVVPVLGIVMSLANGDYVGA